MQLIVVACLLIAGVIHLLPLTGMLGVSQLAALYKIEISDPNLENMLRHRAVLFGLLGAFLVFAAFRPSLQSVAIIGGLVSTISFLWLAWSVGGYNSAIARVVYADIAAIACLVLAGVLLLVNTGS